MRQEAAEIQEEGEEEGVESEQERRGSNAAASTSGGGDGDADLSPDARRGFKKLDLLIDDWLVGRCPCL